MARPCRRAGTASCSTRSGHGIDVFGGDGVFQRLFGLVVAQAPGGRAAAQHRDQAGFQAVQLGEQHVAEQVVVAVPLAAAVQRHQQQAGPGQLGQRRGRAALIQHRLAQRPAHPLQHRGPGHEHPLRRRDPGQELRLQIRTDPPVRAAERGRRRPRGRPPAATAPPATTGRPPLGPPVQHRRLLLAQHHPRRPQHRRRLPRPSLRSPGPTSKTRPCARNRATRNGGSPRPASTSRDPPGT